MVESDELEESLGATEESVIEVSVALELVVVVSLAVVESLEVEVVESPAGVEEALSVAPVSVVEASVVSGVEAPLSLAPPPVEACAVGVPFKRFCS